MERILAAFAAVLAVGCSDSGVGLDAGPGGADTGSSRDAGQLADDAGPRSDAGAENDSGAVDSGTEKWRFVHVDFDTPATGSELSTLTEMSFNPGGPAVVLLGPNARDFGNSRPNMLCVTRNCSAICT